MSVARKKAVGRGAAKRSKRREKRRVDVVGTLLDVRIVYLDKCPECKCLEETLEKSGTQVAWPIRSTALCRHSEIAIKL